MFLQNVRRSVGRWSLFFSSSSLSTRRLSFFALPNIQHNSLLFQNPCRFVDVSLKPTSPLALSHRFLSSSVTQNKDHYEEHPLQRKLRFSYSTQVLYDVFFHHSSVLCVWLKFYSNGFICLYIIWCSNQRQFYNFLTTSALNSLFFHLCFKFPLYLTCFW